MHASDANRLIAELAARHKGLVRRDVLLARGIGRGAIDHRLRTSRLFEVQPGVYSVHLGIGDDARLLAAVWSYGTQAVASDGSGAAVWQLLGSPRTMHLTVPPGNGVPRRRAIVVHRRALPPRHVTQRHGIPVTTLVRTILDLAASSPLRTLENAFHEAQVRHHLAPADVQVEAVLRRGHRGTAKLRTLLADAVDPGFVESHFELRFLRFCAAHGLPRPETQVPIGPWRADFLFAALGVVVETDSRFHDTAVRRRKDAAKTAGLEALGYVVVRLRWADVVDRPDVALARLHAAFAEARVARVA